MADVKWIKICTDIFDDDKILLIESMPEADGIIVIWFKLLCMAGKHNNSGVFTMNERLAYTDEMLATIFRRPINTVRLALGVFEKYGMIEIVDGTITIPNWEKHQSLDKIEKAKELTRQRVAKHREKQKKLTCNGYSNVTVTESNGTDKIRIDKNRLDKNRLDKELFNERESNLVIDMFNDICKDFSCVETISEERKNAVKKLLEKFDIEQVEDVFRKAQASDFLKGLTSKSDWVASFDWLVEESNFVKVLDGNYDNKVNTYRMSSRQIERMKKKSHEKKTVESWENKSQPKTAGEDESIKARAEALQQQLRGD
jgi:predicted phage replisome organizer